MTHFRLRTQLFIATLLIICGLTGALLLIIRQWYLGGRIPILREPEKFRVTPSPAEHEDSPK